MQEGDDDVDDDDEEEEGGSTPGVASPAGTLSSGDDLSEWSAEDGAEDGAADGVEDLSEEDDDESRRPAAPAGGSLVVSAVSPHTVRDGALATLGPFELPPFALVPRAAGAVRSVGGACPTVQALTRMAAEHARSRMLAHAPGQVVCTSGTDARLCRRRRALQRRL